MAKGTASGGDTPLTIGLQLAMAFGQGAGVMLATSEALMTAYNAYLKSFEDKAREWPEHELRSLEYARALGFLSAFTAAQNGRAVIDVEDVRTALGNVRHNRLRPLMLCSLTPIKPKGMEMKGQPK